MRLIFLGAPGAGKGTQAERTAASLGVPHISTGDIFRRNMADGTSLGRRVREIVEGGGLVPDEITTQLVVDRLAQPDALSGFILDGFPRTLGQARALEEALGDEELRAVVALEVPSDELVRRMLARGRADDSEESIRRRLRVYAEETEPLIGFYRDRGLLVGVSGMGGLEEIADRILAGLGV